MSGSLRLGIYIVLAVVAVSLAIKLILLPLLGLITGLIVPLALIAGIGFIIYALVSRKSIGGGGRRYLP